ncbi:MAG: hypothetical protein IJ686_03635 [Bacteroidales bacterium]|nr:hypothetical protein [Bacteroidales bacterium]
MKKYLYFIATAILGIFAASCAKESREAALDSQAMVFSVKAPFAVTKAMNDGLSATDLTFAVYDDGGNYLQSLSEGAQVAATAGGWTVTVSLVKQMTYNFFFFAQSQKAVADSYYNIDLEAKTLTVDYAKAGSNNEFADAFYKAFEMTIDDSFNGDVTLVRPFAQINAAVSDLAVAEASNISLADMTTGFKVKNAFTTLNILDGSVDGEQEIELPLNAKLSGTISADGSDYDWIAAAYLLVDQKQTADITLSLKSVNSVYGADVNIVREVTNVPLQRNYRTNLLGPLFSSSYTFNVNIDEGFITPEQNVDLEMTFARANTTMAAGNPGYIAIAAQGGENTLVLPDDAGEITIDVLCATTGTITVKYPDGASAYPAKVNLLLRASELVANLEHSTVTITKGSNIATGTFATASSTLIIEEGATVTNLIVNAGSTKIYGTVETISGTAKDDAVLYIKSVEGFKAFRDAVNAGKCYTSLNVELEADIDLANEEWIPIGNIADTPSFIGTFNGNGHTISNLYVNVEGNFAGGLFGNNDGCTLKDFTIDGAEVHTITSHAASGCAIVLGANQNVTTTSIEGVTVKNAKAYGNRRVAIIAGYYQGSIKNCTVENATVIASVDELAGAGKWDNGDKNGILLGYANGTCTLEGNSIDGFSVTGYRHLGSLAGYAANSTNIKNNTVKNGKIIAFSEHVDVDGHTIGDGMGELIGKTENAIDASNTWENVSIVKKLAEGVETDGQGNYTVAAGTTAVATALKAINADETNTNPVITVTEETEFSYTARDEYGNDATETITIDGGGNIIRFHGTNGDWSSIGAKGATLIIKNAIIYKDERGNGAWNNHALNLTGNVIVENVTFHNSVSVAETATFTNVNFVETGEFYTAIIKATTTSASFNNCTFTATNKGRGIKVMDQYVDAAACVQCEISVSGCTFETAKKAAVLVTNTAGAKVNWGEGNDISAVAADSENAVWNDSSRKAAYDLVVVNGCTKIQEQ